MEFLGMARKKKNPMDMIHDPIKKSAETEEERKKTQQSH
jgi:hypothetical protein